MAASSPAQPVIVQTDVLKDLGERHTLERFNIQRKETLFTAGFHNGLKADCLPIS
jgi:hypothetical protein